uniref:Rieske domain-containing protein n=1 Tax=Denticeps clupeoides TaxID=299321 RepID=A0A8C4AML9_9TELE
MTPGAQEPPTRVLHRVGSKEELLRAKRVSVLLGGREVLVLHYRGRFHALDARCYHSGGPLQEGDIEEIAGRLCIVCPWHKYKITLAEGEGLYQAADPKPGPWCSKGVKQRVHSITESGGDILVALNDCVDSLDSDYYQSERYRATLPSRSK